MSEVTKVIKYVKREECAHDLHNRHSLGVDWSKNIK